MIHNFVVGKMEEKEKGSTWMGGTPRMGAGGGGTQRGRWAPRRGARVLGGARAGLHVLPVTYTVVTPTNVIEN